MSGGLYSMEEKDYDKNLNLKAIKPYGDTMNDGKVQLSFTLPVPAGDEAVEAAKQFLKGMGLDNPQVVFFKELTPGFTFFNCYGSADFTVIHVPKVESTVMDMPATDEYIRENIGRKLVVVGASTGTDAHTVGIDAIMNMKGYAGHYGLERYDMIEAYNLGSQVPNEDLRTSTSRTSPSWWSCSRPRGCATRSYWPAADPASPTSWPRNWAMTPASA